MLLLELGCGKDDAPVPVPRGRELVVELLEGTVPLEVPLPVGMTADERTRKYGAPFESLPETYRRLSEFGSGTLPKNEFLGGSSAFPVPDLSDTSSSGLPNALRSSKSAVVKFPSIKAMAW